MQADVNLSFLQFCPNEDLRDLCDILTHNQHGEIRINEQLTNTHSYRIHYPDNMNGMWEEVAMELQRFGGNTFANLFRGGMGADYLTILKEVCRKYNVAFGEGDSVSNLEMGLLTKVCVQIISNMNDNELRELSEMLGMDSDPIAPEDLITSVINTLDNRENEIFGYLLSYWGGNLTRILNKRGVIFSAKAILGRSFGFLMGSMGRTLIGGCLMADLAGPAYRVTIPAVIQIAVMRFKYHASFKESCWVRECIEP
ncbi:MAG: DUF3944 domain-containing protein [Bacteroides sp.]|nr:DUF3944 domain-containing protein [Bacteroides sp.]